MSEPRELSIPAAAVRLGVSTKTITRLIDKGELTARNVSTGIVRKHLRVSVHSIDRYRDRKLASRQRRRSK